jgi:hypothetical protein
VFAWGATCGLYYRKVVPVGLNNGPVACV